MEKSQIEITNLMLMHMLGMIGIVLFTLLFISLMTGSESRASALKEETIYYNYARRMLSSSDCLAYETTEAYFSGGSKMSLNSKIMPGILDMSKAFDFNHLNCLKYDLVSGAISNDPKNKNQPFPVVLYEISIYDIDLDKNYFFASSVFQSKGAGQIIDVCIPGSALSMYPNDCLLDCEDVRSSINDLSFAAQGTSMEGLDNSSWPTTVLPGVNCWEDNFNDAARSVIPYEPIEGFNCSSVPMAIFEDFEYGNVFESSHQYFSKLRYRMKNNIVSEHDGVVNIKFCVINIPTMCDPFFEGQNMPDALSQSLLMMGINPGQIYDEAQCLQRGLPLI